MESPTSQLISLTPATKKSSVQDVAVGFSAYSLPPNHVLIGDDIFVDVSDFEDKINVHIQKFKTDEYGRIISTQRCISFSPFVWQSFSNKFNRLPMLFESNKVVIISNTLFITEAWIDQIPHISLQRFVMKKDFSREFIPSVCLLTEREWLCLGYIRKAVSESCKSMFNYLLKKKILSEVSVRSPCSNLDMKKSDIEMVLTTSLTETLSKHLEDCIADIFTCDGCKENQPNQLAHDCITMSFDTKHRRFGTLALFSIDIELLAKDFLDRNAQMINYVNQDFLNGLNFELVIKNAGEMYISSDLRPYDRL